MDRGICFVACISVYYLLYTINSDNCRKLSFHFIVLIIFNNMFGQLNGHQKCFFCPDLLDLNEVD